MFVILKWKGYHADRYPKQQERRDYSVDKEIIDTWVKAGWCEIVARQDAAGNDIRAVESPPKDKAVRRKRKTRATTEE